MAIPFATDAWIKALQEELNNSPGYQDAARNWEGDFYFVVNKGNGMAEDAHLYMDLWHGQCREAFKADDPAVKSPEFELSAPLPTWAKVIQGKMDPIRGLMSRQLKLKGNMMKIMKTPKAATELVNCCTRIDTEWPV